MCAVLRSWGSRAHPLAWRLRCLPRPLIESGSVGRAVPAGSSVERTQQVLLIPGPQRCDHLIKDFDLVASLIFEIVHG